MASYYDALLLDHLKQEFCHLNLDKCGAVQKIVVVTKPTKSCVQYTIQVTLRINKFKKKLKL